MYHFIELKNNLSKNKRKNKTECLLLKYILVDFENSLKKQINDFLNIKTEKVQNRELKRVS